MWIDIKSAPLNKEIAVFEKGQGKFFAQWNEKNQCFIDTVEGWHLNPSHWHELADDPEN